ncbi:helix-turn-helix transcriptional regulator [Rhodanobacter geophilus]|uniref:Helix-turn-helix transcriptional regulator n=1 Tax=Rhodanobacter geophilus TaxID=3162488 RepID=A0ABV3QLV5_9GAMM
MAIDNDVAGKLVGLMEFVGKSIEALGQQVEILSKTVARLAAHGGDEDRVMRESEVAHKVGLSASTVRNRCTVGHPSFDPDFPQPQCLGSGKTRNAVGWRWSRIRDWIDTRPTAYLNRQVNKRPHASSRAQKSPYSGGEWRA